MNLPVVSLMNLLVVSLLIGLQQIVPANQTPAPAQTPPDVEVLKFNWSRETVGWEKDPFKRPIESHEDMQRRERASRRPDPRRTVNAEETIRSRQKGPTTHEYRYKVTVKNTGTKIIKSVDWDYIFLDASGENIIGYHQFTSDEKIEPGKIKQLTIITSSPPVRIVDAGETEGKAPETAKAVAVKGETVKGQVVIKRIEYKDGTVWVSQ
jgi:hypothetical protein